MRARREKVTSNPGTRIVCLRRDIGDANMRELKDLAVLAAQSSRPSREALPKHEISSRFSPELSMVGYDLRILE